MSTARRTLIRILTGAALVATLAGCSLIPSIPDLPTGGDGGGSEPGSSSADEESPFDSLPATFPADVPLVEGEVLQGIDVGTGWSVLLGVDDAVASFTEAADALVAAGYEERTRQTDADTGFGNFTNDTYSINLSADQNSPDYGAIVIYTVVRLS
jgi:hypothetical protein